MSEVVRGRLVALLGAAGVELAPDGLPRAVPDSTAAVARVCGLAHAEGWRVRLEGQGTWCPPDAPADLALSTRGLARVLELAPADLVAGVEAGIGVGPLQRALEARGAWLALDPPGRPERSIGSVVATATAGPLRHGYGPVRDHLLGVTVVTGDGRVVKAGGQVVKNVAGYDLTRLQAGGFGAFGVVTELWLRLRARPAARVTLLARGGRDALSRAARDLMERNLSAAALELCSPALAAEPEWVLALELAGTQGGVAEETARVTGLAGLTWTALPEERGHAFWGATARAAQGGPVTLRMGVFPDGLDETIDLLHERLDTGLLSAGPGRGMLRWSGEASPAALRAVRRIVAEREIPLTLERAPWPVRSALGHYGAYREGVGTLVGRLRQTFDPDPTFAVALEGTEHE